MMAKETINNLESLGVIRGKLNSNFTELYGADLVNLKESDIGSTVQGYDANTTKNDVANNFLETQTITGSADTVKGKLIAQSGGTARKIVLASPAGGAGFQGQLYLDGTSADLQIGTRDYKEAIHIKGSNGNVGIGTTSPGEKLEVLGNCKVNGFNLNATTSYLTSGFKSQYQTFPGIYSTLRHGGNTRGLQLIAQTDSGSNISSGRIGFLTSIDGTAATEKACVDSNGNVGIGTTSPSSKLSVVGLPTSSAGLSTGGFFTQTATQLGGSGTTKVVCVV